MENKENDLKPKTTQPDLDKFIPAVKSAVNKKVANKSTQARNTTRKVFSKTRRGEGGLEKGKDGITFRRGNRGKRRFKKFKSPFQEAVVSINRVSKTTKGGRKISFNALVVVGDKKGRVGFALGKASEVPSAIKKAIQQAQKKVINVNIVGKGTIPHAIIGHFGSGQVFLKDAPEGTGLIAGSATRIIMELAGIKNIYSKIQGSKTPINVVRATMNGLENLKISSQVAELRNKDVKEL